MASSILAVAAHPGDGLFTMGAQVGQQVRSGAQGAFLSLTLGEKGSSPNDEAREGEAQFLLGGQGVWKGSLG